MILGVLALAVVGWWCIRGANKDRQAHMVTQPSGSPGVDRTSVDAGAGAPVRPGTWVNTAADPVAIAPEYPIIRVL